MIFTTEAQRTQRCVFYSFVLLPNLQPHPLFTSSNLETLLRGKLQLPPIGRVFLVPACRFICLEIIREGLAVCLVLTNRDKP